ncbi:protein bunched, class 2/F/G isoform-like [Anthonomus grandis grandis]|uniref:protein bunched, class 2/F/G isoform-like n=1 Tax=Anthonomus grandis grandis TaxID=2921223 RepID=UPI002166B0B8|nr:protein bunched, class 2/F/G isoform-like [Anthonomus grandis grandis]
MNTDPRRPDKIQRYVTSKNQSNGDDLTPDYMNIMGQPATTTANAAGESVTASLEAAADPTKPPNSSTEEHNEHNVPNTAANVIPTSPQYGVAIIPNENNNVVAMNDLTSEQQPSVTTGPTVVDSLTDSLPVKTGGGEDSKDIHTTPSRNERFKVVKIASLEPFKRGRWKCMDYVDEAPPPNVVNVAANKVPNQVTSSVAPITAGVYLQTQSLPQQQIQQMLLQGGQFFPNVPAQLIPQGQYFYPQVQPPHQQIPTQFINNQPYFSTGVVAANQGFTIPQSYPNIQYVPIPAQGSAFVPTSQAVHNFQQSQSYSGSQTNISQMVNGHAYPEQPNQPSKTIIVTSQPQQNHVVPTQPAQSAPVIPTQQYQQQNQNGNYQQPQQQQQQQQQFQPHQTVAPVATTVLAPQQQQQQQPQQQQQNFDASNVYTNPQFTMSVNSLTVLEGSENVGGGGGGGGGGNGGGGTAVDLKDAGSATEMSVGESQEDSSKSNPVVNAIDNKIEQAMDLVKSHLMYTVREEVEVLKEKIAELMERIQQLETENNYLRSQIPKSQSTVPPPTVTSSNNNNNQQQQQPQPPLQQQQTTYNQQNIAVVPPQNSNNAIVGGAGAVSNPPAQPPPSQNQTQTIPNLHQNEAQQVATATLQ